MAYSPESVAGWEKQREALCRGGGLAPGRVVHLVGIGGIGMAGIALHLQARGLRITGSDLTPSRITDWLAGQGIAVQFGHRAEHVPSAVDWLVKTPAVSESNPEVQAARRRGLPVVTRGVVLPALLDGTRSIAVSGTHGKTTTSSMIAQILHRAGRAPSHCIGGEVDRLGGVAAVGQGPAMVVEADESDGTLVLYRPELGVLTNVEYDHMEHFGSEADFIGCFRRFVEQVARLVYCIDDPIARELGRTAPGAVGYGRGPGPAAAYFDYRPHGRHGRFTLALPDGTSGELELRAPGEHQAANATAAAAAAWVHGIGLDDILDGLRDFAPPRRRFEVVVERNDLVVVSDYAHHPSEIRAVIAAARDMHRGRLIAVYQPHRYTRTRALLQDFPAAFSGLDELVLAPVYAASEPPLAGGTASDLLAAIQTAGTVSVRGSDSLDQAWAHLQQLCQPGDLVLVLGAGDVEQLAFRWTSSLRP